MNSNESQDRPQTVDEYVARVPLASRAKFEQLRKIVQTTLPAAQEVISYGIVGYKVDDKRPRVFISGWIDHLAIYPLPTNDVLRSKLAPYIKGKGTLWFKATDPLPQELIEQTVRALAS